MHANPETITILIADDDADDRLMTFEGLVTVMRVLGTYWIGIVELPEAGGPGGRR